MACGWTDPHGAGKREALKFTGIAWKIMNKPENKLVQWRWSVALPSMADSKSLCKALLSRWEYLWRAWSPARFSSDGPAWRCRCLRDLLRSASSCLGPTGSLRSAAVWCTRRVAAAAATRQLNPERVERLFNRVIYDAACIGSPERNAAGCRSLAARQCGL